MRATIYFLSVTLSLSAFLLTAQVPSSRLDRATSVRHHTPPPGLLESFLDANPNATVLRHKVGGLSAPGGASAKFIAVVACDPLHPQREAKGLEVVLKNGKTDRTVYLDYDPYPDGHSENLNDLARRLTNLARKQGKRLNASQAGSQRPANNMEPFLQASTIGAYDRPAYLPACCPRYTHLNIGLYRRGAVTGNILIAPAAEPVSCRFPGASLDEVVRIIQSARQIILER